MFKAAGYRIGPSEIENCLVKHPAVANAAVVPSPDETRGNVVKAFIVLAPRARAVAGARGRHPAARAQVPRALRIPEGDRVHRRAADDDDRQGAAARAARARACAQGGGRAMRCMVAPRPAPHAAAASRSRSAGSRPTRRFRAWATAATLWSVTRTPDELSIVCPESAVPRDVAGEPRLARARVRRPAAARPDRHPRERHRAARRRARLGVRARDLRHRLRADSRRRSATPRSRRSSGRTHVESKREWHSDLSRLRARARRRSAQAGASARESAGASAPTRPRARPSAGSASRTGRRTRSPRAAARRTRSATRRAGPPSIATSFRKSAKMPQRDERHHDRVAEREHRGPTAAARAASTSAANSGSPNE